MGYRVYLIHKGKTSDITAEAGNFEWKESKDSLGTEFSFDYAMKKIYVGDIVVLKCKGEILRGIITTVNFNDRTTSASGFDFAFYLNKSECNVQFKKISASKAIQKLLDRYEVPVGDIPNMPTLISTTYKDKVVSDVLKDILSKVCKETGKHYHLEMKNGKIYITKYGSTKLKCYYTDELGRKVNITHGASINGQKSIEERKTKITYTNGKTIKAVAKSAAAIKTYGLLEQVESEDGISSAKARTRAKNLLNDLNKISITFTAEMMGNNSVRPGRRLHFENPEGWFTVSSVTHTLKNGRHTMSCEMEN